MSAKSCSPQGLTLNTASQILARMAERRHNRASVQVRLPPCPVPLHFSLASCWQRRGSWSRVGHHPTQGKACQARPEPQVHYRDQQGPVSPGKLRAVAHAGPAPRRLRSLIYSRPGCVPRTQVFLLAAPEGTLVCLLLPGSFQHAGGRGVWKLME